MLTDDASKRNLMAVACLDDAARDRAAVRERRSKEEEAADVEELALVLLLWVKREGVCIFAAAIDFGGAMAVRVTRLSGARRGEIRTRCTHSPRGIPFILPTRRTIVIADGVLLDMHGTARNKRKQSGQRGEAGPMKRSFGS